MRKLTIIVMDEGMIRCEETRDGLLHDIVETKGIGSFLTTVSDFIYKAQIASDPIAVAQGFGDPHTDPHPSEIHAKVRTGDEIRADRDAEAAARRIIDGPNTSSV